MTATTPKKQQFILKDINQRQEKGWGGYSTCPMNEGSLTV